MFRGDDSSTALRTKGYDPPLVEPPDDDPEAARLRDAPLWERLVRIIAALLIAIFGCLVAYDFVHAPRRFLQNLTREPYAPLFQDADAGRLDAVDDTDESYVRWRTRDGAVFEIVRRDGYALRGEVARRTASLPAYRDEPVDFTDVQGRRLSRSNRDWMRFAVFLPLLSLIYARPRPRHATRWAWAWVVFSVFLAPLYLLFAGSWTRTVPPPPEGRRDRRVGGLAAWLTMAVVAVVVANVADRLWEDRHRRQEPYVGRSVQSGSR